MKEELRRIAELGRLRAPRRFAGPPGRTVPLDGRPVRMFSSNDYLGLATHPDVVRAAQDAVAEWGTGSGGSRLLSGSTEPHFRLEEDLARLKGTEDAVLFPTGYQANLGAVAALAGRGDLVASDERNHASIVDGCRLSRAEVVVYAHADAQAARASLRAPARRRLLVTDGVFSMDGDEAPLAELAEMASDGGAMLMVDDAHGTGVLGNGAGTAHQQGVARRVDLHMGTLSKALASQGGFVAGSREVCDLLRNMARSYIFSTSLAPASVAAATAALRIVRTEPDRRTRLLANAASLRSGLASLGLAVPAGRAAIVPVVLGSEAAAMEFMKRLEESGFYAGAVRPPTVAPGSCRLRLTAMATHTEEDVEALVAACGEVVASRESS